MPFYGHGSFTCFLGLVILRGGRTRPTRKSAPGYNKGRSWGDWGGSACREVKDLIAPCRARHRLVVDVSEVTLIDNSPSEFHGAEARTPGDAVAGPASFCSILVIS